jgi:Putative Phosphatase
LAQGQELEAMRESLPVERIVYCGDGANDLCPALALGADDVVLVRRGHALERLIRKRADGACGMPVVARVLVWETHAQLFKMVQDIMS